MRHRPATGTDIAATLKSRRDVDYALEGVRSAAIYDGTKREPGMAFMGSAIVEDPGVTIVVHPGSRVEVTATATSTSISGRRDMREDSDDRITLEITQNSLQAAADEMLAAMCKSAMSSIIYEVLDIDTGILDARGRLASSGAGIPGFIGVLDKSVQVWSPSSASPAISSRAMCSSTTIPIMAE